MDMEKLPVHTLDSPKRPRPLLRTLTYLTIGAFLLVNLTSLVDWPGFPETPPPHSSAILARCRSLSTPAGPPPNFHKRRESDRFVPGTKPVLVKNAKIWTGRLNGTEVVSGDVLLDNGIIQSVGFLNQALLEKYENAFVIDAEGAWVTPGIVDVHSHLGDYPSPELSGASDGNSIKGPIQPWLRSLDALNTHDDSYELSISGGVTTSLILPGSANAIGGQGFVIKLRKTKERSPTSMLLEPPYTINASFPDPDLHPRWRQMKHACGENPSAVYRQTRMDTMWAFREAYNKASKIKREQDGYCAKALSGHWDGLGEFPEDLQWEALVEVVRGRVKVQTHCYEAVDLDDIVRLSNEFKFPIAAFHHASEAYLVPNLLKKAYGPTPAIALFATNARYKREAFRASEFAPRILASEGLSVAMKSDHAVLNSRYLLYEAQQAHFYGFPSNLAIASVTSTPAKIMGLDHRIGYIKEGWDADLVVWDSHPLALGATPKQVFIDGIPQLVSPHIVQKPGIFQKMPDVPNFDKEAADAVAYEGLPPLAPSKAHSDTLLFTGVRNVFTRNDSEVHHAFSATQDDALGVVLVRNGAIVCAGTRVSCKAEMVGVGAITINLKGGSISPGLVSFGSPLGLEEIAAEDSTNDGLVLDPLLGSVPKLLGGKNAIVQAVDGLKFATRDAYLAYRAGVTTGITAPTHSGFYGGLGTSFSLGAAHRMEEGAIVQEVTGLHVSVRHFGTPSISTQIAALRRLLLNPGDGAAGEWFRQVTLGEIPLVVEAHSADVIATLVLLKKEVEKKVKRTIQMTITGAAEAHILAKELGEAGVGIVLNPPRPFPYVWEDKRILPGPPLTEHSAITQLLAHGITVGVGIEEIWSARNARFDIGWAAIEGGKHMSKAQAFALGSTNLEKLLGVRRADLQARGDELPFDLVATQGGDLLEMESKVVAVLSPRRKLVDLF